MTLRKRSVILFIIISLVLCLISGFSCKKNNKEVKKQITPSSYLYIFALDHIRESGFETVVIKDFAKQNNIGLRINLFSDLSMLMQTLSNPDYQGKVDIVMGLDNSFFYDIASSDYFTPVPEVSLQEIRYEIPRDSEHCLIPYASANLAFIYDSRKYPEPPHSFGELQDSKYYSQLAICDPSQCGLGRSTLLWTVALFSEQGYEQLWSSLRKNIYKIYPNPTLCLDAIRTGKCGLMFGYNTIPAWLNELYPSESHIKSIIPEEGSFLYVESAALCKDAPHKDTALQFLKYLISPNPQQFVMYKLAMMPVNGRTPLPTSFAHIPAIIYSHNNRLEQQPVQDSLQVWMSNWKRMMYGNIRF